MARDLAFADAKAKATRYAELAGGPLGAVRSVTDGGGGNANRYECAGCGAAADVPRAAAVPLAAGSRRVRASSTVVWDLG